MLAPKSHKNFIAPAAKKAGVDETLMEDLVGFYYADLRKNMIDIKSSILSIPNLGSFKVKSNSLNHLKAKLMNNLKVLENPETFSQMAMKKDIEQRLVDINRIQKQLIDETERRKEIKTQRKQSGGDNIQEQKSDS